MSAAAVISRMQSCQVFVTLLMSCVMVLTESPAMGQTLHSERDTVRAMARRGPHGTVTSAAGLKWTPEPIFWVEVKGTAEQDEKSGLWTYSYEIANADSSQGVIEAFGVTPLVEAPVRIGAPQYWAGKYGYSIEEHRGLVWIIADPGSPPADWVGDGANTYPSSRGIAPGKTLRGFTFTCALPPAEVSFTVQIWEELGWVEDGGDDQPTLPFFSTGATGRTVGPRFVRS